jgi:hypothetical protein
LRAADFENAVFEGVAKLVLLATAILGARDCASARVLMTDTRVGGARMARSEMEVGPEEVKLASGE